MGEMKESTRLISVMLHNIPMSFGISALCEGIAIAQGNVPGWIWPMYLINVFVAWVIACLVGWFLDPPTNFGVPVARKYAEPGSPKFGLIISAVANTVYTLILNLCMTTLNTQILAHAPIIALVMGVLVDLIPVWIVCFIITAVFRVPCENLARKICDDPAPAVPAGGPRGPQAGAPEAAGGEKVETEEGTEAAAEAVEMVEENAEVAAEETESEDEAPAEEGAADLAADAAKEADDDPSDAADATVSGADEAE